MKLRMIAGAVGIAALIALVTPKTAHALVATMVQVVNTATNPVQTVDTEKLARIPYQSSYRTTTCTGLTNCFFSFTAAPAGYRLVVENLSGLFEINNAA